MILNGDRLNRLLLGACFLGYIWLFYNLAFKGSNEDASLEVCLIRNICHIPCPSCGSTRAIIALLKGNFSESVLINPLGLIVAAIMLLAPFWILYDHSAKRQSLYNAYKRLEVSMQSPLFAVPLILLIVLNWVWNISKGL
jgi:cbb3-type cytochrome oxidase subunit 3